MKFLICGIGSIGQRHWRNLRSLGHEVSLLRSRRDTTPFIEKFFQEQESRGAPIKKFFDLDDAMRAFRPDAVFVTNPNSRHMETALPAARAGLHLFIEKPISHTAEGVDELERLAAEKNLRVMVGYNLRFHPLLAKMKELFDANVIGAPIAADIEMGENIEDWHPWEDYRHAYAAYKKGGGGAVLCFSHDIDYLLWFFGMPDAVHSVGGKITPLGGDAEDMVKSVLAYKNGMIASFHLDYWQRPAVRRFKIIGRTGTLIWDYYAKNLSHEPRDPGLVRTEWRPPAGFDRNDTFVDEVKNFIAAIETGRDPAITLADAKAALDLSFRIKFGVGF